MSEGPWRIYLLGRLQAQSEQRTLNQLSMRRVGALLACLTLRAPHPVPREELLALLWPEEPADIARNRLRVLLSSLRQQLEPANSASGPVLAAERNAVQLIPAAFTSDYHDFLRALQSAKASAPEDGVADLETALALYRGELLAGYYDEWILSERSQLAELHYQALRDLVQRLIGMNAPERAIEYARQTIVAEPLDEEAHYDLIRLYAAIGQPSVALRQYEQLKRLLHEEMQAQPSMRSRQLVARIESSLGHGVASTKRVIRPMALLASEQASGAAQPPDNLPPRLTRFFGREKEITRLRALLAPGGDTRLVSLLGPGGTGKTRLAIEVAEQLQAEYDGRVYFVPLAEITEPNRIGILIANSLRLPPAPGLDPLSQALAVLNQAHSLLILDNLEQLLPEAAPQIEHLLLEAASLHCLLTSRRSAGIPGEQEITLGPLPQPDPGIGIEEMLTCPGVALFVDRVRSVRADFALTANNAEDVAQLCRALEGLPLAIELAAARARVMTPAEMRSQTDKLLNWLVDIRGGKTARHRSLRATLEWSYRLLTLDERRFFNALSVFVGGFTAEAACHIGLGNMVEAHAAMAMLEQLCAASLLKVMETDEATTRFGMLDTLREFGVERLVEMGKETEIRSRHLAHFAGAPWEQDRAPLHPFRWTVGEASHVAVEDGNLREALEFGLRAEADCAEQSLALCLASRLAGYWEIQGRWSEGRTYLRRASLLPESVSDAKMRANVLRGAGVLAYLLGDYEEARSFSEEGLKRAQVAADPSGIAGCLSNLGHVAHYQDDYTTAQKRFEQALNIFKQAEDWEGVGACLISLGNTAFFLSDHKGAKNHLQEALNIYRQIDDRHGAALALQRLGNVCRNQGYADEAHTHLVKALAIFRSLNHRQGVALCLHDLGLVARLQNDVELSQTRLTEALQIFDEIGFRRGVSSCLLYLGGVAQAQGNYAEALSRLSQSMEICRKIGERRNLAACLLSLGRLAMDQDNCGEALSLLTEALQIEQEIDNAGGRANCLSALGHLALAQDDLREAHHRFSRALEIYRDMGVLPDITQMLDVHADLAQRNERPILATRLLAAASKLRSEIGLAQSDSSEHSEARVASIRAALGEPAFTTAWREGESLSPTEAIAEALQHIVKEE